MVRRRYATDCMGFRDWVFVCPVGKKVGQAMGCIIGVHGRFRHRKTGGTIDQASS